MDRRAVRAAFDDLRRGGPPGPGVRVERQERVTRTAGPGWGAVVWSDLDEASADDVVAAQVARFAGVEWEWKLYAHDRPPDLADRLRRAGLVPEPSETVLVADLDELRLPPTAPDGVRLVPVDDEAGIAAMVAVHEAVFGGVHPGTAGEVRAALAQRPRPVEAVVAWAGDTPVCAGRVTVHEGTGFAGLWGGGTLPAWRGRGVFRALVAHRAALAARRGSRFLTVDATAASRPLLERWGFVPLTETTPWVLPPG